MPARKDVTLEGSVPNADQRAAAEATARRKAKGYRVKNLLRVATMGQASS